MGIFGLFSLQSSKAPPNIFQSLVIHIFEFEHPCKSYLICLIPSGNIFFFHSHSPDMISKSVSIFYQIILHHSKLMEVIHLFSSNFSIQQLAPIVSTFFREFLFYLSLLTKSNLNYSVQHSVGCFCHFKSIHFSIVWHRHQV